MPLAGHPDSQGTVVKTTYVGKGDNDTSGLLRRLEIPAGQAWQTVLSYVVTNIITIVGTSEPTALTPGFQAAEFSRCPLPQVLVLLLETSRGTAGTSPRL